MPGAKTSKQAIRDTKKEIKKAEKSAKTKVSDLKVKLGNLVYYKHCQDKQKGDRND